LISLSFALRLPSILPLDLLGRLAGGLLHGRRCAHGGRRVVRVADCFMVAAVRMVVGSSRRPEKYKNKRK